MNHRIAKKILKKAAWVLNGRYSTKQLDQAHQRVNKHQPPKRPECDACGTFIDKFYPTGMPSGMVPPGLCADCYKAAGIQPEHDPREGGEQWAS